MDIHVKAQEKIKPYKSVISSQTVCGFNQFHSYFFYLAGTH